MKSHRRIPVLLLLASVLSGNGSASSSKMQKPAPSDADFFARDELGRSYLHNAVIEGDVAKTQFLLRRGLDVDARTMLGETALHFAAGSGNVRLVKLLLAAGASPRVYTKKCLSPREFAAAFGGKNVFALLKAAEDRTPLPTDGTATECDLKAGSSTFASSQLEFFRHSLAIHSSDDYPYAVASMRHIKRHPPLGEKLFPELLEAVDHSVRKGHGDLPDSANNARMIAVDTLHHLSRKPAHRELVGRRMLEIFERGTCSVFAATACQEADCEQITPSDLLAMAKSFLTGKKFQSKAATSQICQDCQQCESGHVGQAHAAAVTWFQRNPAYQARAKAILRRQVKANVLPKPEFDSLMGELERGRVAP